MAVPVYSIIFILLITKIVQLQMTDNQRSNGKEYLFSLVRLKPECKIQPTFVDFEPLYGLATSTGGIIPIFNQDHCHFTPAFLLPSEKKTQTKNMQTDKLLFEHRVRQAISSSDSVKIEDLAPSSNYCQICQEYFKNYDDHLVQKSHFLRWHHNEFNEDIEGLCHLVEDSKSLSSTATKHKLIKKPHKKDARSNAIKGSPKTTIDNNLKRKMSLSEEAPFSSKDVSQEDFNL